jgi:hypothetical protein
MKSFIAIFSVIVFAIGCSTEPPATELEVLQGKAKEWIKLNPGMGSYLTEQGVLLDYSGLTLHEPDGNIRVLMATPSASGTGNVQVGVAFYVVRKAVVNAFMVRIEKLSNGVQQVDHVDISGQLFNRMEYSSAQNIFTKVEVVHPHPGGRPNHSPFTLDCFDTVYTFSPWVQQIAIGSVITPQEVLLAINGCALQ